MEGMMQQRGQLGTKWGVAAALMALLVAGEAQAHISFEQASPPTHLSRYGDAEIKAGPCGRNGGTRGTNVYTYEPGQTITVSINEFIAHSGYFRIAFDNDGDDGFLDPQSIDPVERACQQDEPLCGESDFNNNDTVLMDNLEPHGSGTQDGVTWSWEVTLPNVECDNCTLQVIQVMEDHGKYQLDDDVYHTCIDLVLKRGAPPDAGPVPGDGDGDGDGDADGTPTDDGVGDGSGDDGSDGSDDGASDGSSSDDGDGTPGASDGDTTSGGCALGAHTAAHEGLAVFGLGLIALAARRRRRRTR